MADQVNYSHNFRVLCLLFKNFGDTLVKSATLFFEIERGRQDLHRPARLARDSLPRMSGAICAVTAD
jgi:hypothetical protein